VGVVTDHLRNLIAKQVSDHGLVVWFDPDGSYLDIAQKLDIDAASVARYERSFLKLRRDIEPLISGEKPPRLVVYVPLNPAETHDALVEVLSAGVALFPGANPWQRNTRLSVVARHALKAVLGDGAAESIEKQVETGKLTIDELDRLAEQGEGIAKGSLSLIFGTTNPLDVGLAFLSAGMLDEEIVKKGAVQELAILLGSAYDLRLAGGDPTELRSHLARHVLSTELIASLQDEIPTALAAIPIAKKPTARAACCALARTWRLRRDLRESYATQAKLVEKDLGLAAVEFSLAQLSRVETFQATEESLQLSVEGALLSSATEGLVELARLRQSSFWSELLPTVQARWALIATAGLVILESDRVANSLKGTVATADSLFEAYVGGDKPWCLLDTYQRHLERRIHAFDFGLGAEHRKLQDLLVRARQLYMEVGSQFAEAFVRAYREADFAIPGVLSQREIFSTQVLPSLESHKTAYFLVDALRYEMCRELAQILGETYDGELKATLGTVPSITEVGMAALLPRAESPVSLVQAANSKLALQIDGVVLKDRKDRIEFLKSHVPAKVFDTKLEDLLPLKKPVRSGIEEAGLILVTSQEIDALAEGDNIPLARRTMDDVLRQLQRAFKVLADLGVSKIVVTADHGYLFGDEVESDMKIDAPGGVTADLHRRVWVGRGGAASPSYLRATAGNFGLGGDLEIAVPWNFACFKAGGARAFFHGGLSPQEIVVPVMALTIKAEVPAVSASDIVWSLEPGSKRISTRFFSIQVRGQLAGLFKVSAPKVRLEIRDKTGPLSTPISASYGFDEATGDVQLRLKDDAEQNMDPDTITVMINRKASQAVVSVRLLDARTGRELAAIAAIEMAIAL
jgi:hypothetical protein